MGELIKAFRHFLSRDLMYLIGGSITQLAFLCLVNWSGNTELLEWLDCISRRLDYQQKEQYCYLIFFASAYFVGYIIQEIFSFLGIINMGLVRASNTQAYLMRNIYKRKTGYEFRDPEELIDEDYIATRVFMNRCLGAKNLMGVERVISLKHIGSAIGSNLLVASILFAISAFFHRYDCCEVLLFAIILFILSGCFIAQSWIMGMHQAMIMCDLKKKMKP